MLSIYITHKYFLKMVSPENVYLTGTDMFPEVQQYSHSGGKLAIANTVITRTSGCPLW